MKKQHDHHAMDMDKKTGGKQAENKAAPEQLWVSDITYIPTLEGFSYMSLITDDYSRRSLDMHCIQALKQVGCILALEMEVEGRKRLSPFILIHHSTVEYNIAPRIIRQR